MNYHAKIRFILTGKWYEMPSPNDEFWEIRTRESRPEYPFGFLIMRTEMKEIAQHLVYLHNQRLPK